MSDVAPDDFSQEHALSQSGFAAGHTLGQRLSAEREARGWAVDYVAGQLNLAPRQIQALESDNYAALPGIASVRGFVRAYAKLLKVEADPLVALIASEQIVPNQPLEPKPNLSSAPFAHSRLSGAPNRGNSLKGVALALVVGLLAAGAIGIEHMGGWPTLSQSLSTQFKNLTGASADNSSGNGTSASESHDTAQETLPAKGSVEGGETAGKADSDASQPEKPVDASASVPPTVPVASAGTPASVAAPVVSVAAATAPAAALQPKKETPVASAKAPDAAVPNGGTLVLTARQNSWIDLRAGGNVIASHLLKAGDTENIEVPGAAQLTIGNAAGVDATFRGQSLVTTGDGKSNVAHISLK
ncbi:MAG TPA: RodZ domain-containing protein [Burkholderiaceae bacterium]